MFATQSTRRSFLATLAILSAEAALASVSNLLPGTASSDSINSLWERFCKLNNASSGSHSLNAQQQSNMPETPGHRHIKGQAARFQNPNLIALPTLIFWEGRQEPADIVVHFYDSNSPVKRFALNRFELEALCELRESKGVDGLAYLYSSLANRTESFKSAQIVTAKVYENNRLKIYTEINGAKLSFNKQLIHHV